LVFSLLGFYGAYWLFLRFEDAFLYRYWAQSNGTVVDRYLRLNTIAYPFTAIFLLLEMLVLVFLFWPLSYPLKDETEHGRTSGLNDVSIGVGMGLAGFAVTIPFLWGLKSTPFISGLVKRDRLFNLEGVLEILLFVVLMPIGTEVVFRAIAQRKFKPHMSPLAAIILSAVMGACLTSIFNFPFLMALGLVCGALFWWRGALLPAIAADIVMTMSAIVYVALRT
jgi:membrane protease YdiL (CAAX protease family)